MNKKSKKFLVSIMVLFSFFALSVSKAAAFYFDPGGDPEDIIPPTVSITSPTNNQIVSGSITIQASASDNVRVNHVEFKIGDTVLGNDYTASYSIVLDTNNYIDKTYTITAKAYDSSNNYNIHNYLALRYI